MFPALVRSFMTEYVRNPVNLLLFALVPAVFVVVVVAATLADAARLLGGVGGPAVETATAGWAAGFLAGIATYFQVSSARDADRRLVLAVLPARVLVRARWPRARPSLRSCRWSHWECSPLASAWTCQGASSPGR